MAARPCEFESHPAHILTSEEDSTEFSSVFFLLSSASQKLIHSSVWLELRSPLLLPFESKSQLLSPYKKAKNIYDVRFKTAALQNTMLI